MVFFGVLQWFPCIPCPGFSEFSRVEFLLLAFQHDIVNHAEVWQQLFATSASGRGGTFNKTRSADGCSCFPFLLFLEKTTLKKQCKLKLAANYWAQHTLHHISFFRTIKNIKYYHKVLFWAANHRFSPTKKSRCSNFNGPRHKALPCNSTTKSKVRVVLMLLPVATLHSHWVTSSNRGNGWWGKVGGWRLVTKLHPLKGKRSHGEIAGIFHYMF